MRALERRILALAVALPLMAPVAAWTADDKPKGEQVQAEPPADKPKDEKPKEPPAPTANGAADAFVIESQNGDLQLVLGMVAQTDGRFSLDDPKPIINTFTIRKIRPTFTGRITRWFNFKVMPDFGNGTTIVQDAYFDVRFSPAFRLRIGKDKTPVGYELLEGDAFLLFPERALASSLVPNRDIGIQAQGDVGGGKLFYAAGVFNGIPDGTSSTTELDTNNSKDLAGRVLVQPFKSAQAPAVLNGLGFQVGGSVERQVGALPSFKTSVGQTYFSYNNAAAASGVRKRVSPAVFYYYKSFGGFAEYMRSAQPVARDGVQTRVTNQAWEVTASILVTGEAASYTGVRPKRNFDPAKGHWGALQLLGRYTTLRVDRAAFTAGLAAANASREARSFTIAANWYPTAYIKYYATFERTVFDGDAHGPRPAENVILVRAQLGF
jgi:phosphate-selective porin OprO/OprP